MIERCIALLRQYNLTSYRLIIAPYRPTLNYLTPRAREIAAHVPSGLTCKEIGRKQDISHRTVEVHRGRLMRKLKAKNSAELGL